MILGFFHLQILLFAKNLLKKFFILILKLHDNTVYKIYPFPVKTFPKALLLKVPTLLLKVFAPVAGGKF